jgi:hypothetical protein
MDSSGDPVEADGAESPALDEPARSGLLEPVTDDRARDAVVGGSPTTYE